MGTMSNIWDTIIEFLKGFTDANKDPDPPDPAPNPNEGADRAVAALQEFLNQMADMGFLDLDEPLVIDGWLGPKTDAAIEKAISRLRALLGAR